jgi:hypothetical protein
MLVKLDVGVNVTVVKLLHCKNTSAPIVVIVFGIVTDTKFVQPSKTPNPNVVTPLGIFIDVKLEQNPNASVPIDVTVGGMVKLFNLKQL